MKSLKEFLLEELNKDSKTNEVTFKNLRVKYDCPENLYIEAPESYSESDIQIYLDDKFLKQLPGSEENAEKFFGNQEKNIQDVYFEYDSIDVAMGKNQKADIEWDPTYDDENEDAKLQIYQIKNLKYVIEFSEFTVEAEDEHQAKETLDTIFNSTVSNNENKYDITISLNVDNMEFEI